MWRNTVCTGCEERCRYRDLKGVSLSWWDAYEAKFAESVRAVEESNDYSHPVRRAGVLGLMHQSKREFWDQKIETCSLRVYYPHGPFDEVVPAEEIRARRTSEPNDRQKEFLSLVPGLFNISLACSAMPTEKRHTVRAFLYRLIKKGLIARVSGPFFLKTEEGEHTCTEFGASLVKKGATCVYKLVCLVCSERRQLTVTEGADAPNETFDAEEVDEVPF